MEKPQKTFADYLVIAISPVLIMVMVGSLAFFLIQVFYDDEMVHGLRWLMFWFVLAIVLVSRLGIEQSKERSWFYGGALAVVTWFYLVHMHKSPFLGMILLAITWWCAHKVTIDCTLIKEDEDASGEGVLEGLRERIERLVVEPRRVPPPVPMPLPLPAAELIAIAEMKARMRAAPRPPGRWIVYFSLLALPLFGLGQLLLPKDDPAARRIGFAFLAVYLSAALCLLMTTSFLGLRRYLRQRRIEMPTGVAFSWIRFGVILIAVVLALALILPRPDASKPQEKELVKQMEPKEHKASDHALPFNPPGQGEGTPGDNSKPNDQPGVPSQNAPPGNGTRVTRNTRQNQSNAGNQPEPNRSDQGSQAGQSGPSGESGAAVEQSPSGERRPVGERPQSERPASSGTARPSGNPPRNPSIGRNQESAPTDGGRPPGNGGLPENRAPENNSQRPESARQLPPPSQVPNIRAQGDSSPENQPGPTGDPGTPDAGTRREQDGPLAERPPGNGIPSQGSDQPSKEPPREVRKQQQPKPPAPQPAQVDQPQNPENTSQPPKPPSNILKTLLRVLLIIAVAGLLVWAIIKYRKAIAEAIRSFISAAREFFRKLFNWSWRRKRAATEDIAEPTARVLEPFATYENPFLNGNDRAWPPQRLLYYTYEAIQSWARDQGIEPEPQQTPREFCDRLIERFPDFGLELERFSFFYSHAAFATQLPEDFDPEYVRRLWQYLGDSVMVVSGR